MFNDVRGPMPKDADVLVIDDDPYFTEFVKNLLADHGGYHVVQAHTVEEALERVSETGFKLVIMDLKMPPGSFFSERETGGGLKTGLALAREMKRRLPGARLILNTGGMDLDVEAWFAGDPSVTFLYKTPDPRPLLRKIKSILDPDNYRLVPFIVHGRDRAAVLELKAFLQNRLGFAEPIVLSEMPSGGRTVMEKFEHYASQTDVVFALVTPDDEGHLSGAPQTVQYRARQNVVFELGYFLGYLRRQSGRVFLLQKGPAEIPSDLAGIVYIDISNGIEAAAEQIRRETADLVKQTGRVSA